MIGQMGELPSQPGVYLALAQALADSNTSLGDVAQLVEQDMAMSAKCRRADDGRAGRAGAGARVAPSLSA
jgi:hypothetical protein